VGVDPAAVEAEVDVLLAQVLSISGVDRPDVPPTGAVNRGMGRDGRHTESMGHLLAEMQVVARTHPSGRW
jgi:ring-1,2-phenylacetyl-CoA epoxidase subunit PaaC